MILPVLSAESGKAPPPVAPPGRPTEGVFMILPYSLLLVGLF
jgi:hypothetical protein